MIVGIVIPCYNAEKYIAESIESVLEQDHEDIIVTVIDDKSTDGSAKIINEYVDKDPERIHKLFFKDKNQGAAVCRNYGAQALKGLCDYYLFHDADDVMAKNSITARLPIIQNDSVLVVYSDYWNMNEDGEIVSYEHKPDFNYVKLVEDNFITCLSMVRADVFHNVGGFNGMLTFCEDHDLWLRIAEKGYILHVPEPLFSYRANPDSQTRNVDWNLYNIDKKIVMTDWAARNGRGSYLDCITATNEKINYKRSKK